MKTVLIHYELAATADVADVERHIRDFVAGIRALGVGIRYASHRKRDVAGAYTHVGHIPDDAALAALQAAPFFKPFAEYLRSVCEAPPRTSWWETVASSEA